MIDDETRQWRSSAHLPNAAVEEVQTLAKMPEETGPCLFSLALCLWRILVVVRT